jgi:hypothetical protein
MAARAEHRARIERVERFGHLHRDPPRRRRPPRRPVGLRTWRTRRPILARPRPPSVAALADDGVAIEEPGGGHQLADDSLALGAGQTVA